MLIETFASQHSLSLQQTLFAMGKAALEARPEVAEVRIVMPNKHHFVVDLSPFGIANENEVFYASDRPYGLIGPKKQVSGGRFQVPGSRFRC